MTRLLTRTKLGFALWGAFGLLLLLAAGQSTTVVTKVGSVGHAGGVANAGIADLKRQLSDVETSANEAAIEVSELASRVRSELATSMEDGEAEMQVLLRNVTSAVDATGEIVNKLEELLDSDELDEDTAGTIEDLLFDAEDSSDRIRKKALPLVRSSVERLGATAETSRLTAEEIAKLAAVMERFAAASQSVGQQANGVSAQIESISLLAADARWLTIGAAGIVMALGIAVPLILVPRISREVGRVTGALEAVAKGELNQRMEAQSFDEFQKIATSFNAAVTAMENAVGAIRTGSTRLANSSDVLNNRANTLTRGADETTQLAVDVATSAEAMSSSMSEIAASVEQVSSSNIEISAAADRMLSSIRDVSDRVAQAVAVADEATELVESGSEKISRLGSAAGEISEVSQVIQDIADMTNLLALNATIEAARAGEAGKGFAVVATEVKSLAKQTSEATEQIRHRIEAIQFASGEAVDLVTSIDGVIRKMRDESNYIATTVDDQDETTKQIAAKINEAAQAGGVVATNVSQTALTSGEIARSISQVDVAAKKTATVAAETRDSGNELLQLSNQLNDALSVFQTPA